MSQIAESFKWITSENPESYMFIAVDERLRIYFNKATRKELGARRVVIGYDHANKRIIIAKPDVVRAINVKPHNIDKRGYASARSFVRSTGITKKDLPQRYEYLGQEYSMYPAGAYVFGLRYDTGEDGGLDFQEGK